MKTRIVDALVMIALVFAPIQATILSVGFMTFMDLLTGILAARKRGEPITSLGLRRTVSKLLVYELLVCLAYITEVYMTGPLMPIVRIVAGFIGLTELKSVMENLEDITGMPLIKTLIEKLTKTEQPPPPPSL